MFKKTPTPNTTEAATNTEAASVAFDEIQAASMLSIHRASLRSVFALKSERDFLKLFNAYVVRSFVGAQRLLSRVNFELEKSSLNAQDAADALRLAEYGTAALDFDTDECRSENGDPLPVFDVCSTQGQQLTRFLKLSLTRARCLAAIADLGPLYQHLAQPDESTGEDRELYLESFNEWLCECPLLESAFAAVNGEKLNEEDVWMLFEAWRRQFDESVKEVFDEEIFAQFIEETEDRFHFRSRDVRFDEFVHGMIEAMPSGL